MAQIIVQNAEILQVHVKESTNKETKVTKIYHSAFIFQGGDRPQFFQVNIKHDDPKRQAAMITELDGMTRKGPVTLVLEEFRWDGRSNYNYVGTLESFLRSSGSPASPPVSRAV